MTKVNVISGFLGAGKTTLIKKLLDESFKGEKIVLIENEFGEIGIDGGFLKDAGVEISEMNSGCICCSLVGDFGEALKKVMEQFHPDRYLFSAEFPMNITRKRRKECNTSHMLLAVQNRLIEMCDAPSLRNMVVKQTCKFFACVLRDRVSPCTERH